MLTASFQYVFVLAVFGGEFFLLHSVGKYSVLNQHSAVWTEPQYGGSG